VPLDEPVAEEESAPAPELTSRRRWLTGGADEEPAPEAKPAGRRAGGTLFERMASRGAAKTTEDDDKDPLDIPRFLRSQNNQ
jgi:cell division protein FtsZ